MPQEFINPNWHILLLHFPLGLIIMGVLIELFSFLWSRSTVRTAGKWMFLLGTVLIVPTATLGLYAFKDAAAGSSSAPDADWQTLVGASRWTDEMWEHMDSHIWWEASATVIFVLVVLLWLGGSDNWRRRMHLPLLVFALFGVGLMVGGAWFSGEGVYRHGLAVIPQSTENAVHTAVGPGEAARPLHQYLSPLQIHLLFAGLAVGMAVPALGLSIRRWSANTRSPAAEIELARLEQELGPLEPRTHVPGGDQPDQVIAPAVYPARFWLITFLLALLTAAAGIWYTEGTEWVKLAVAREIFARFTSGERESLTQGQQRLAYHIAVGGAIILLPLILTALTRFTRRSLIATLAFMALLLGAVAAQVWLGILLLYRL